MTQKERVIVGRGADDCCADEATPRRGADGCSGGPTSRNGGFSPLKQPTTTHNFAWPASVTCSMSRPQISKIDFIFN